MASNIAWHYTTGKALLAICVDRFILPATARVPKRERPAVWFTTYEHFEPTARKSVFRDGEIETATLEYMADRCHGLVRLGVDTCNLLPWGDVARATLRMQASTCAHLEAAAREQGSDPSLWFVHVGRFNVGRVLRVEVYSVNEDTWSGGQPDGA